MRLTLVAAAMLTVAVVAPALAQDAIPSRGVFKTGREVQALCTSAKATDLDSCDFYLMGTYDMAVYFHETDQAEASFCLPAGVTALAVRNLMLGYWRKNPDSQKYSAVSNIINALDDAYPGACKQ